MKQIDLDPKGYRNSAPIPAVGWWFFGSLAVCIAAMIAFWATSYDNLAMLAMFLGALNLGKSYARWADPSGSIFLPDGLGRLGGFFLAITFGLMVSIIVQAIFGEPLWNLIHWVNTQFSQAPAF